MEKEEQKSGRKAKYKSLMDLDRGERLKKLIKEKGTQESFFEQYGGRLGVSFGSLKNYMAGSDIPLDVLLQLIDILDTTADFLLFGNEDRKAKKDKSKSKDKIPLTDVYRSIKLLMEACGEYNVRFDGDDVSIRIRNRTVRKGVYQIKKLMEFLNENNENTDLKETLEETIEKILKADGYVVEHKLLYGREEIYVYNSKTDFLKFVEASGHYKSGDYEPAHYEIMPIWESDNYDGEGAF